MGYEIMTVLRSKSHNVRAAKALLRWGGLQPAADFSPPATGFKYLAGGGLKPAADFPVTTCWRPQATLLISNYLPEIRPACPFAQWLLALETVPPGIAPR